MSKELSVSACRKATERIGRKFRPVSPQLLKPGFIWAIWAENVVIAEQEIKRSLWAEAIKQNNEHPFLLVVEVPGVGSCNTWQMSLESAIWSAERQIRMLEALALESAQPVDSEADTESDPDLNLPRRKKWLRWIFD